MTYIEIRHFHLFGAIGGGAKGFNKATPRAGSLVGRMRCIGSVDVDIAANRDFQRLVGVTPTLLDLFSRKQYIDFHGHEPPVGWREAVPADIRRAAGNERPHIVFLSAPCKGFSGLLSEKLSLSRKYQALNELTERGVLLMLEAWADDPPELIVFENVPRIAQRGRALLDRITALLRHYGYAVAETTHDCGELGGLAQTRKRFLLVARHQEKVPPFLYQPPKRPLQAVGSVLGRMPMPGDSRAGPMHRLPALQWKTWIRLAFVEAGSDWRSLNKLVIDDGYLRDFAIAPDAEYHAGVYGVRSWQEPSGAITSRGSPSTGTFAVADPRIAQSENFGQLGVRHWSETSGAVSSQSTVGGGTYAVADPRIAGAPRFNNCFRIVRWSDVSPAVAGPGGAGGGLAVADPRSSSGFQGKGKYIVTPFDEPANTVIAASSTGNGAAAVADPRVAYSPDSHRNKLAVMRWNRHAGTVTGANQVQGGALAVADPRVGGKRAESANYESAGTYGVMPWDQPSCAVASHGSYDNGRWSVADPRLPVPAQRLIAWIRALDGTWHRPFTTFELAGLQSLVEPEEQLELDGMSDSAWRERIGNAVPPEAACAIATVMGQTLLLAWSGETFSLSATPIWVRPIAVALSVRRP